jgi:predicted transcriptional regulator
MTILDRLARKGVVTRRKTGKAWVYRASLSAGEARSHAVAQVVAGFFEGSPEALAAHLAASAHTLQEPLPDLDNLDTSPL